MDLQSLVNAISDTSMRERSNYHATFGDLIDRLKNADDSLEISPKIIGIGAYRGYYSDIALCTESGSSAYKSALDYYSPVGDLDEWYKENEVKIDFTGTPKELGAKLESILGFYLDGYRGGYNEITRNKPLWVAPDYGDSTGIAVVAITEKLELVTKQVD